MSNSRPLTRQKQRHNDTRMSVFKFVVRLSCCLTVVALLLVRRSFADYIPLRSCSPLRAVLYRFVCFPLSSTSTQKYPERRKKKTSLTNSRRKNHRYLKSRLLPPPW
ncbi:hypothetical protein IWZ03DRAFT_135331 [Phyllosticta citriasiana]|uniref:Secreted protein n=1 Tax=Phyllosticta citriasiana TaxID=595635 RepID=A0ABR1KTJ0_9PEZI